MLPAEPVVLAADATTLRHEVRLVHAGTGATIGGIRAQLEPTLYGWSLRTMPDGVVVVVAHDNAADPPAPPPPHQVVVTVVDGLVARLLVIPPLPDRPPNTVVVPLRAATIDVPVQPQPQQLTVVLSQVGSGDPATGLAVVVEATSGPNPKPTVPLPEVAAGVYTSALVEWAPEFRPADLLVGVNLLRQVVVDPDTPETRFHLVDTT